MVENVIFLTQTESNPIAIGIGVIVVLVLLVASIRALGVGIGGAILGAIIGPIFLGVSAQEGATGGFVVFAILGFIGAFTEDDKKK